MIGRISIALAAALFATSALAAPAATNAGTLRGQLAHAALVAHGPTSTPISDPARRLSKMERKACFGVCMDGEALTENNFAFCEHSCY